MSDSEPQWRDGAEEYLRAVIESTADGILVVDQDGKVVSSNRRFAELWRIPDEIIATRDDDRLIAYVLEQLLDREAFEKKIRELYRSSAVDLDVLRFRDGRVFERYSSPLMRNGKVSGRVWSFRDVTERRRVEEERLLLERRIRETQKLESLGLLAGGIAHDFNNLLVGILGNADLAISRIGEDSLVRQHLTDVVEAARQAGDLCNELLAYSGKGSFVIAPVNLGDVVRDMSHLLEVSISKKVVIRSSFADDLPTIEGDVSQLRQVVMNLITNAADAIGEGDGVVEIGAEPVVCDKAYLAGTMIGEGLAPGEYVALQVRDNGSGMTSDTRARIFEPFFTTKARGRGLGLATVLGIVRGHRGTIQVESCPGRGSTFRALFPVSAGRPAGVLPAKQAGDARGDGVVMVVDDEPTVRLVAGSLLEAAGFDVIRVADGQEAIEELRKRKHVICAVLLDLTMPGLDGAQTLRALREIAPGIGVVLSSGYHARATEELLAKERRPFSFIQKPYRGEELVRHILEAIG